LEGEGKGKGRETNEVWFEGVQVAPGGGVQRGASSDGAGEAGM
jgi:hypothetical protein